MENININGNDIGTNKYRFTIIIITVIAIVFSITACKSSEDIKTENDSRTEARKEVDWLDFYTEFIKNNYETWEKFNADNLKYDLVYINNDDIPELVLGYGDNHVCRMFILTSDGNSVYNLGYYGDSGTVRYVPHKNILYDCAGGQGFFRHAFLSIAKDGMIIKNAAISDTHTLEAHYYILDTSKYVGSYLEISDSWKLAGTVENADAGSVFDYNSVWDESKKEINEQEFEEAIISFLDDNEVEKITYRELKYSLSQD